MLELKAVVFGQLVQVPGPKMVQMTGGIVRHPEPAKRAGIHGLMIGHGNNQPSVGFKQAPDVLKEPGKVMDMFNHMPEGQGVERSGDGIQRFRNGNALPGHVFARVRINLHAFHGKPPFLSRL